MDQQVKEAMNLLQTEELADFEFTSSMKQNVLDKIVTNNQKKSSIYKRVAPYVVSAAVLTLFFTGTFILVQNQYQEKQNADTKQEIKQEEPKEQEIPSPETEQPTKTPESTITPPPVEEKDKEVMQKEEKEEVKEVDEAMTPPDLYNLLKTFKEKVYQSYGPESVTEVGNISKFNYFTTKADYLNHFSDFITPSLAETHIGYGLEERSDGLYFHHTDGPYIFDPSSPYEVKKVSDFEYQFNQIPSEGLSWNGRDELRITFTKTGDNWIISKTESIEK
ncbi:hypothetical protein FZW96_08175 [Bacillus sp. BGMRC 2118]|nr:hypothetical protein FZW96_08175 [Bacillus sp. BGMRC 2118]